MSIPNVMCVGCRQPYNDTGRQPQALDCGHGTCKTCLPFTLVCQRCNYVVQTSVPNYELAAQMREHSQKFSDQIVKTTKQYQDLEKSLDGEINDLDSWMDDLREDIIEVVASEIVDGSKDLEPKAQELVTLGLFDNLEEAKTALSETAKAISRDAREQIKDPLTKHSDRFFKLHKQKIEPESVQPATISIDSIYSCGICTSSYTAAGGHQPFVFSCGHGSCSSCEVKLVKYPGTFGQTTSCHLCRRLNDSKAVNIDLIDQMRIASNELSERFTPYERVIEFKQAYLCQSKREFKVMLQFLYERTDPMRIMLNHQHAADIRTEGLSKAFREVVAFSGTPILAHSTYPQQFNPSDDPHPHHYTGLEIYDLFSNLTASDDDLYS